MNHEALFACMVISLILAALLTPLLFRSLSQWRLRRQWEMEREERYARWGES